MGIANCPNKTFDSTCNQVATELYDRCPNNRPCQWGDATLTFICGLLQTITEECDIDCYRCDQDPVENWPECTDSNLAGCESYPRKMTPCSSAVGLGWQLRRYKCSGPDTNCKIRCCCEHRPAGGNGDSPPIHCGSPGVMIEEKRHQFCPGWDVTFVTV